MKLIHLIPNGVYIGIGIGVVIILFILLLIVIAAYATALWRYIATETSFKHYICYYLLRRRWPTSTLRKIYIMYSESLIGKHFMREMFKYRLRNIRIAGKTRRKFSQS